MYTVCDLFYLWAVVLRGEDRDQYQLSPVKLLIQSVRTNLRTSGNLKNL